MQSRRHGLAQRRPACPPSKPFLGGFGLLTREGVRKPAYFAYEYLNALKGLEVPSAEKATNRTFFGSPITAGPAGPLELELRNLPPGDYRLQVRRTGFRTNDAQTAWLDMGKPDNLNDAQLRKLHTLTADTAEVNRLVKLRADAPRTVPVTMRSNDVVLVTLASGAKPQPKARPKALTVKARSCA